MYSLSHILNETVEKFGANEAVCDDHNRLTYKQLGFCAERIAEKLRQRSVNHGDKVGLLLNKSVMAVASIYGIFKVNATYVPIDVAAPPEKIATILKECNIRVVIATEDIRELLTSLAQIQSVEFQPLYIELDPYKLIKAEISNSPSSFTEDAICTEDSIATILFTSGSTGKPKGVVISHGNILPFIDWVACEFKLNAKDRLVSHAPLFFDLSLLDLFATLKVGASVYLINSSKAFNHIYLCKLIQEEKISLWQSVPSALKTLSQSDTDTSYNQGSFSSLKNVLFAGEKLSGQFIQKLANKFPAANFYNIYGCTETNDTFFYAIPSHNSNEIPNELPIGLPLPYVKYQVLDTNGNISNTGELYVNSPTNMQGYYGSDNSFITLNDGLAYYKTGDLVSIGSKGLLNIQGRVNNIVKVNGYRVSLVEIEDTINEFPDVSEAMVFLFTDKSDINKLVAVIYSDQPNISKIGIRLFCADKLPMYKRPDIIIIKKEPLSKTPTGKIDRIFIEKNEMLREKNNECSNRVDQTVYY